MTSSLAIDSTIDKNAKVLPTYSNLRYAVLCATPVSWRCKLYCRGAVCKYCSTAHYADQQAILGIYSSCYRSYALFAVYFYNFVWADFCAPQIQTLLNAVKVIHFALKQGKIAIHCHAGLGRTGVLIAAYLIWSKCYTSNQAISFIRSKRPNSVQSKKQIITVDQFWQFLEQNSRVVPAAGLLTLDGYMRIQQLVLCNREARRFFHLPKIIFAIMSQLMVKVCDGQSLEASLWSRSVLKQTIKFNTNQAATAGAERRLKRTFRLDARKADEVQIIFATILHDDYVRHENQVIIQQLLDRKINMRNCIRNVHKIDSITILIGILDQFMRSLIKPLFPADLLHARPTKKVDHCFMDFVIAMMAALCDNHHTNAAKVIARWCFGYGDWTREVTQIEQCLIKCNSS